MSSLGSKMQPLKLVVLLVRSCFGRRTRRGVRRGDGGAAEAHGGEVLDTQEVY